MITKFEPLLTIKELAAALRRHASYVAGMKRRGFVMPGGTATLTEAREWLRVNPTPRSRVVETAKKAA